MTTRSSGPEVVRKRGFGTLAAAGASVHFLQKLAHCVAGEEFVPHVCIVDGKRHIRRFLEEALEELGLTACECTQVGEQSAVLDGQAPDLVITGLPTITP